MNPVIIIPSRIGSTRLPRKALREINGKPLIIQCLTRALEADVAPVYVATDDEDIKSCVEDFGGNAVMTDPELPSGTDRIWQAYQRLNLNADTIINVQGDLPTIDPASIKASLEPIKNGADISTLICPITNEDEKTSPNVVKAVIAEQTGKALYFTRTTAPYGEGALYHHIGLYTYRKDSLERFVKLPPSPLEQREKLEQLRALENDISIYCIKVNTVPLGVDVEPDIAKAEAILNL